MTDLRVDGSALTAAGQSLQEVADCVAEVRTRVNAALAEAVAGSSQAELSGALTYLSHRGQASTGQVAQGVDLLGQSLREGAQQFDAVEDRLAGDAHGVLR